MNIYISYSHEDLDIATQIYSTLRDEGLTIFLDKENIPAGEDWERFIQNKIPSSDAVILLWSKNAAKSVHVMRELTQSLSTNRKIIPCLIDDEPISPLISNIQYLQWSNSDKSRELLFDALGLKISDEEHDPSYNKAVKDYRMKVFNQYSFLRSFGREGKYPIEELYLPLKVNIQNSSGKSVQELTADELISSDLKRIIILGLPGSGKSTLLKYLSYKTANEKSILFPILVRISDLMDTDDSILEFISQYIKGIIGRKKGELISSNDNFCRKNTLLLLDGLDEIMPNDQSEFKKRLMSFYTAHPDCKILITSRFAGAAEIENYQKCFIKKLNEKDIEKYIWTVCDESDKKQAWNTIKNDSRILELAKTPFLLSMMTASPEALGGRAFQRATLFQSCIKYLLRGKNWDEEFLENPEYENEEVSVTLTNALKIMAVRFFKLDAKDTFEEEEILFIIRSLKENKSNLPPSEILRRICNYSGLLQRTGSSYYFIHRSIWEYFVAIGMKDEPVENLLERANIPMWEEPIRLYIGLTSEKRLEILLVNLWKINKGLTLRSMTELPIFPDELLSKLISDLDSIDRLRVIQQLKDNIENISNIDSQESKLEPKRLLIDTLGSLLKVEKDCYVIYESIKLLEHYYNEWGFDEFNELVENVLDLSNAEKRLKTYIENSDYKTEFVCVPNGSFIMGTNDKNRTPDEKPEHEVNLDSFCICKYPVTNKLFYDNFPFAKDRREERSNQDNQPVIYITWYEAYIFAKWLGCDLPTEAEWEFSCRSGGKDDHILFDYTKIPNYAWYVENSNNMTHEVGIKLPNSFGLYDMLGNVREWCKDWFLRDYYKVCLEEGISNNPLGPNTGDRKVLKGGCFDWNIANLVPTYRNYNPPLNSYFVNGFRLVFRGSEEKIKYINRS